MSFLGDLVNSIGTDKAPVLPKPVPRQPLTSSAAHSNPTPRPNLTSVVSAPAITGLKRKLDERDTKPGKSLDKFAKPNASGNVLSNTTQKASNLSLNGTKTSASRPPLNPASTVTKVSSSGPTKPRPKGSYAEVMARAKEAQQTRTQNPIGTIKHQATSKEKISKIAERRRLEQEKSKAAKEKTSKKTAPGKNDRRRSVSPTKKPDQAKTPRAPRPPLHAPQSSNSYKGTMGISSKKPREQRAPRKNRNDEYLGTDEEEDSEMDDYGDGDDMSGYGSEGSSDMEAGMDDIDMEERQALKHAKEDDAKELALENELKREKEERKRRLTAMAKKGR